jgi:DNA polymerase-2
MPAASSVRGFVLQPTYRVEAGRPVVHLYGRLESGGTFLVRDTRRRPGFYVVADDVGRAHRLGAEHVARTDMVTLVGGTPVARVEVAVPGDAPPLRERLTKAGIVCHEADVRFAMRYLMDSGIRGSLSIVGASRQVPGVGLVFDDPQIAPADWTPQLGVLAFDIETDPTARRLLSIALYGCGASEVLLLAPKGAECPEGAHPFASEAELLAAFARRVREIDPDVITGWNVVDFDFRVLERVASRIGRPLELGRGPGTLQTRDERGAWGTRRASIPGRVVLDGIQLLRGAFVRMEEYTLDFVAREVLGEGKSLAGPGRAEEIERLFREDPVRFCEYNLRDARLALEIVRKLNLVELAVARSRLTGMPLDRVSASIASFDFLYLSELGRRGIVAPSVGGEEITEPTGGGHVLEPLSGLYPNVIVLDFRSLYPSVIRTFQIDPWNLVREPGADDDPIVAPNGAAFGRRRGILTQILDELMPERAAAQSAGDRVKSQAIKILMNSFYGVLGTPACRFYDPRLANAITSFGREVLLWSKGFVEARGPRVLYGDTDSLFVESGEADPVEARRLGERLAVDLRAALAEHVARTWRVESRLEPQFDRLYLRLCLPSMRHGTAGARKRYAGLVASERGHEVVFVGMEAVRGDWTALARRAQRELYARLFTDQPVEDWLRALVADLRAGLLDDQLVYRKALRKDPAAYTATTPPHVAAARKLGRTSRGRVAYVMTVAGAEPLDERRNRIDYEHYVEKQLRPVAEPVLALLGLDFGDIAGERRQLSLF